MDFMEAVKTCLSKYFDFKGRARRSEYWWFYLFTIIGSIITGIIDAIIFGVESAANGGVISLIFSLAVIIPTISAAARRLHDTNRSGWWQLLPLTPLLILILAGVMIAAAGGSAGSASAVLIVVGVIAMLATIILLIVWLATDGHKTDNRFGPSPKYGFSAGTFD